MKRKTAPLKQAADPSDDLTGVPQTVSRRRQKASASTLAAAVTDNETAGQAGGRMRQALRRQAEEIVREKTRRSTKALDTLSPEETRRTLHELQVHQIELEMQNEELRRTHVELDASRERYVDLYNLAPMGYCTLSAQGQILEANRTAAALLGVPLNVLVNGPLTRFIFKEDQDVYYRHRKCLVDAGSTRAPLPEAGASPTGGHVCELRMLRKGAAPFWGRLEAVAAHDPDGQPVCRVVFCDITELKVAENALQASEIRYRRLFETTQDGILILGADSGLVQDVNPFLLKMLGYTRAELLGRTLWDIGVFRDKQKSREAFRRLQTEGHVRYEDLPLERKDGSLAEVEFVSNVYRVNDEKVIQCNIRDITDRKIAESNVRSIAKFPAENPNPILRVARDGRLLYVNASGRGVARHWNVKEGDRVSGDLLTEITDVFQAEKEKDVEVLLGKNVFLFSIVPILDSGYVNLYGRDITELRDSQKRERENLATYLRTNQAHLAEAQRIAHIGNWDWNLVTNGLTWSDEIYRIFGLTPESFGATYDAFLDAVHAEDRETVRESVRAALANKRPYDLDHRIVLADGSEKVVHERGEVFCDGVGRPIRMLGTIQDITERRRAERRNQIVTTLLALFAKKTSRKEYLDAVARVIHEWSGCRCVGIRITNDKGEVPYEALVGFSDAFVQSESALRLGTDQCVCTRVIAANPEPQDQPCLTQAGSFWCANTAEFVACLSATEKTRFRGVCVKTGFASVAIVPVRYHDTILGAVHLADERERNVSAEMVAFAESALSPIVGEAIHRFNMETELRSLSSMLMLAEERARRQLAIALHDTVGQTLALTNIQLGSLGQQLTAKGHRKALAEIRKAFEAAILQTRTLSFELSPPILYELGLGAAIEWLGEDFAGRHGFQLHLRGTHRKRAITESASVLFFQSARELLTNIAKHAEATRVCISLATENGQVIMKIADNGKGMEHNALGDAGGRKNSLGLFSIRERMKYIGGTLVLQSKRGHGTIVTLTAPMRESSGMEADANR